MYRVGVNTQIGVTTAVAIARGIGGFEALRKSIKLRKVGAITNQNALDSALVWRLPALAHVGARGSGGHISEAPRRILQHVLDASRILAAGALRP